MIVLSMLVLILSPPQMSSLGLENDVITIAPVSDKNELPEMYVVFDRSLIRLGACIMVISSALLRLQQQGCLYCHPF